MAINLRKPRIYIIGGIVIILLVGAGLSYYLHTKNHQTQYLYSYKNSQLISGKISGEGVSNGVSFKRPPEFAILEPTKSLTIANFAQDINRNGKDITIGGEAVVSSPAPSGYGLLINSYFRQAPTSSNFQQVTEPIKDFILSESAYIFFFNDKNRHLTLTLDQPGQILLQQPVWLFGFTVIDSNLQGSTNSVSTIKGQVLVTVGKTNLYYLMVGTADYNWLPNISTWGTILRSIKIDQ